MTKPPVWRPSRRVGTTVAAASLALMAALVAVAPAEAAGAPAAAAVPDPASYVDPMVGTGNGGGQVGAVDEFPGPDAPFGMIQWGPDTGPSGISTAAAGYYYPDTTLKGFSLTRLGGVGCDIFGDFQFLPTTRAVTTSPGTGWSSYTSSFSHSQETAKAGYYSVTAANGVRTELTAATRAALGRFTFPSGAPATMLINASNSYGNQGSSLQVVSPDTITGSATGGGFCGHTTKRYTVYFTVTFDHPFTSYGTWKGGTATAGSGSVSGTGTGGWVSFDTSSSPVVNAKVAISYVSVDGAKANMNAASSDFAAVQAQTYDAWNGLLGKIGVSGGTAAEQTTFYTALYHALLDPSIESDVTGQYMGFDFKVHTVAPGHEQYTNFSGWDIYRSEIQLLALLEPDQTSDMMQSLVNDAEQGGWLPKWPTANVYTGMMGGDAADPVIADAYAFGARNFDVNTALTYMLKGANDTTSAWGQGAYSPRESTYVAQPDWNDYLQQGYVPSVNSPGFGTSLTEEYALADFTIGQFADAIGDHPTAATFQQRGQNWQNVFDPGSGYFQPRGANLPLPPPADLGTQQQGFEEGNAAQYTWMVPQNFAGLFAALGGNDKAAARLDAFFTQLNAGASLPYEWMGNEVTLDSPWAYDYLGQPWKTQKTVRDIITSLYGPTPGGEPGNDDLGAMSSWYVWAALGMYPETPGTSTLVLGSPLFPHAVIHLANGKDITINAPNAAADAPYVQDLQVNGQPWPKNYLSSGQYSHGVTLDYDLATTPDTTRGTGSEAPPPSYTAGQAPAIGFTSPYNSAKVLSGQSVTARVGVQNQTQQPRSVAWSATPPAGVTISPSSGTLQLAPGAQATQPVTISVTGTLPPGWYSVPLTYTETNEQTPLPSADLYVEVPATWNGFSEGFENGLGAWTVDKGTPTVATDQAHSGTHSFAQTATAGQASAATIYRHAEPTQGKVSMWFYDDATVTDTKLLARVDNGYETGNWRALGVETSKTEDGRTGTTNYAYRIDGTWHVSSVPRSTGWHQLVWDYTTGTGMTMSIDGTQVASDTALTQFDTIAIGDWWGTAKHSGTEFIDDITVTSTP